MLSTLSSDFGNYSLPTHFNCFSEQEVGDFEGQYLVPLGHVGGEGHGHIVYKDTWSIGCCATWCNMPVPSSCRSLVAFKTLIPLHYPPPTHLSTRVSMGGEFA